MIMKVNVIKKDNLFKPMFRSFRHYYQQKFERYARLNLRITTLKTMKVKTKAFLNELNTPWKLTSMANVSLVMLMLNNQITSRAYPKNQLAL